MKCQKCDKSATFHITEIHGGQVFELHLCEDHARDYLSHSEEKPPKQSIASVLAQQLQVGQTAEELAKLDQRECPVCGITFYEFRQQGRLGCPHDYVCFQEELEPLIVNIHGSREHKGKRPNQTRQDTDELTHVIRLRRDMQAAIDAEEYERASELRDRIRKIEAETRP